MEKREDEKSPRRRDDGSPAALSLVTCCLFPHLTSDDRHLYRALAARLGTRVDEAGTRPAAKQKRPKRKTERQDPKRPSGPATAGDAGAEERDGRERAGPVRIVQWTDSSGRETDSPTDVVMVVMVVTDFRCLQWSGTACGCV